MSRASTQPRVEYVCGLLQGAVTGIARSMAQFNLQEIAKLNEKIAVMTDDVELADLRALKERKIDKGHAANRVLLHAGSTSLLMRNKRVCSTSVAPWWS